MAKNKIYVWEAPVRITHWLNMLCLVLLSITGIYIRSPFLIATSTDSFVMGWFRFIHFVSAYVFVVNLAIRMYWSVSGNAYASWKAYFPFSSERIDTLFKQMAFYALVSRKPPKDIGHTPLAGLSYFFLLLLCGVSVISGFALYSLNRPPGLMTGMFGWVFNFISIPMARLIHDLIMWLVLAFVILHVYIVFLLNGAEQNGLFSSMFDGYKYVDSDEAK